MKGRSIFNLRTFTKRWRTPSLPSTLQKNSEYLWLELEHWTLLKQGSLALCNLQLTFYKECSSENWLLGAMREGTSEVLKSSNKVVALLEGKDSVCHILMLV